MKTSEDGRVMCVLFTSSDCAEWCAPDELYVDANGDRWDCCKACGEAEQRALEERAANVCAVCGQGGYWVGFQPAFGELRCANHVNTPPALS